VEANQQTIIHDFLSFQKLTITINLSGVILHIMSHPTQTNWKSRWNKCPTEDKYHVLETYLISSWNKFNCRRKTKLRSRSLRVVVSSISPSGLSVVRPWEDPFRSNLRCILYSEQKRLPITMKRVWFPNKRYDQTWKKVPLTSKTVETKYFSSTYLWSTNRFNTMHTKELCHQWIFIPANMLIITGKHPNKHLNMDHQTSESMQLSRLLVM
jgi:hypothetical protein